MFQARRLLLTAVGLTLITAPAHADLIVVDDGGGPGADFTDLGPAIEAASDGDTILVRAGTYTDQGALLVDGLSLSIVGEGVDVVTLQIGSLTVRDLAPDQQFTLRGLAIRDLETVASISFAVIDCAGPVWIEDVDYLDTQPASNSQALGGTVVVDGCGPVTFSRVFVDQALFDSPFPEFPEAQRGQHGLRVVDSDVFVYDSTIHGGQGLPVAKSNHAGGDGVRIEGGTLFASGSSFEGGSGGHASFLDLVGLCLPAEPGGDGLRLATGGEVARLVQTTTAAGTDGEPSACGPPVAWPAADLRANGATVFTPPTPERRFSMTGPVEVPGSTTVSAEAPAGEFLFFLVALSHDPFVLTTDTAILPDPSLVFVPMSSIPPGGSTSFDATILFVPGGLDELWVYGQAGFAGAGGVSRTSGGSALPLLDPGP